MHVNETTAVYTCTSKYYLDMRAVLLVGPEKGYVLPCTVFLAISALSGSN